VRGRERVNHILAHLAARITRRRQGGLPMTTSTTFNIGEGVQAVMAQYGDEPRSDERFVILDEGHKVSLTLGRDAQYWYYQEDNRTNRLPFR
jgi:hypothetical protein